MSFSSDTKNEIIKYSESTKHQRICRLMGMLCCGAKFIRKDSGCLIRFSTENPKIAGHFYSLVKNECLIKTVLKINRSTSGAVYFVNISEKSAINALLRVCVQIHNNETYDRFEEFRPYMSFIKSETDIKAFVRGAFISCGSVINPRKNCHLEFVTQSSELSDSLCMMLKNIEFNPKCTMRKNSYVIYFKNGSEISDILASLGAFDSLMEYHNIKIMKDMRNSINRRINCDNANIDKTVDASQKQCDAIEKLQRLGILEKQSKHLREIADCRLKYRELSLAELGAMMDPPIGKSGVNHRLRKLVELAEKYRGQKNL